MTVTIKTPEQQDKMRTAGRLAAERFGAGEIVVNSVDADGTRHLGQAGQGDLHVAGGHHHEIGQFIDNNHDIGQVFGSIFLSIRPFAILGDLRGKTAMCDGSGKALPQSEL